MFALVMRLGHCLSPNTYLLFYSTLAGGVQEEARHGVAGGVPREAQPEVRQDRAREEEQGGGGRLGCACAVRRRQCGVGRADPAGDARQHVPLRGLLLHSSGNATGERFNESTKDDKVIRYGCNTCSASLVCTTSFT